MAKSMYQKRKERQNKPDEVDNNKTNINWYPGHMAKTKRLIKEKEQLIDVIYEIIDARIPFSSKIADIDELIKKPTILIMNKSDLCDLKETNKWKDYYETKGYKVVFTSTEDNNSVKKIKDATREIMKPINEKRKLKGMIPKKTRVLIVGIPNVGKSTLINRLVGKKATNTGNKPGVTKSLEWIRIDNDLELMDTPGILWPKFNEDIGLKLATFTAINETIIPEDVVSLYILNTLCKYYPNYLDDRYGITSIDENTFDLIGKKRGCLIKGGEVDYDKVYQAIINDIKDGKIKGVTFDRYE